MISILQHGLGAAELLRRKFGAMRASVDLDSKALRLDQLTILEVGDPVFEDGDGAVRLLVAGVVGEVRLLRDGRRQIVALRLPGDLLAPSDTESLLAMTRVRLAEGAPLMARLADNAPGNQSLRRAWLAASRTDQAILRDQVVRLGRMSAFERVAHILLEAHERLAQVGLAGDTRFHLPLTQEVMSDVVGLSVVHLNRTLQSLRRSQLVIARQGYVTLADRPKLVELAGYVSRFPAPWREAPAAARIAN